MQLFGRVDGASEDASNLIHFDGRWGGISLDLTNRKARILVGRRGSGKSRYLRAMEREYSQNDTDHILVFPQKDESISITLLRWLHKTYQEPHERIETWRKLWGCAIYTSIATHLLNFKAPFGTAINIKEYDRNILKKFCEQVLKKSASSYTIVEVLNHFIDRYQNRSRLDAFLSKIEWSDVENSVLSAISVSTPIACYIDTLDETFAASPAAATDCQVGLLQWILRKANDPNISNRIHLVITIRETVFSALMAGEHGQRYYRDDMVRLLDWNDDAAAFFLKEKIRLLPLSAKLKNGEKINLIESWLGISEISNSLRGGSRELILDFIIRHTRFLPRDIIQICNAISAYACRCIELQQNIDQDHLVEIILDEAKHVSTLALETVADHIIALDSVHDRTIVSNGFKKSVVDAIYKNFIPALKTERFSLETLRCAENEFIDAVGGWIPVSDWRDFTLAQIFWLHGLIGFEDQSGAKKMIKYFSSSSNLKTNSSNELPISDFYYLHASLLIPNKITIHDAALAVGSVK